MSEPDTSHRRDIRRHRRARRSWLMALPLVGFVALAAMFWFRLGGGDPSKIPSALIGRPAPQTALPPLEGLRQQRRAGARARSRRVQGQGQRRQCLGVVVRALPRRSAAADRARPRTSGCRSSASTTRMRPTTPGAFSAATAIRSASSASTATAAPRSNGASMACRRPSSSAATAPSSTSWSARSRRRISTPCSRPRSTRR